MTSKFTDVNHLHPAIAEKINLPGPERITMMSSDRWVGYPQARLIIERMEELFAQPKKARMPNLLIVGHTNNGKTHILERFLRSHPAADNIGEDSILLPVLYVQAPPGPDESAFYDAILKNFATPIRPRDHARNKRSQVIDLMTGVGTKMLIVDEVHHLLSGDSTKQSQMLNALKYLGNELRIPIVAAGVETAFNAIQIDAQLSNRFQPLPLPRWKQGDEWGKLIATFEKLLPLQKPSNLSRPSAAKVLWEMSEGLIGELVEILLKSGMAAIKGGAEKITIEDLERLDWTPPSSRRRKVETLLEN